MPTTTELVPTEPDAATSADLHAEIARLRARIAHDGALLKKTEQAYNRFVPQEFLRLLSVERVAELRLGMQAERAISVLFCDIRNFTTLSESLTPQENFDFLNSYLSQMEPMIVPFRGVIDKFIGDAIMALFPVCADDAVRSAIAILGRLERYNQGRLRAGYLPIRAGIGINTGIVMLGIVGGSGRMEGTVIGDAVNLAARIESMTKTYDVPLLISEHTLYSLDDPEKYQTRFVGQSRVKGKRESVSVYEVFDADPALLREQKAASKARFEEALAYYYTGDISRARSRLARCLDEAPGDQPARIYQQRCDDFLKNNQAEGAASVDFERSWSEDFSSRSADIDSQHRHLLNLLNTLTQQVLDGRGGEATQTADAVLDAAIAHFHSEQALMNETRYPFRDDHQRQHHRFLDNLRQLHTRLDAGKNPARFLAFLVKLHLTDWLINHSVKSDRHFGQFLHVRHVA